MNHGVLCGLWLLTSALILQQAWSRQQAGVSQVSAEQAIQLMNQASALVLDIRTEAAFAEGHLLGALNISTDLLHQKMGLLERHRQHPIIVVCQMGQQAQQAADHLKQQGFNALVLAGGIQQWRATHLPLFRS